MPSNLPACFPLLPTRQEADGFSLPESASIMRYLCATRRGAIADHWYPQGELTRGEGGGRGSGL